MRKGVMMHSRRILQHVHSPGGSVGRALRRYAVDRTSLDPLHVISFLAIRPHVLAEDTVIFRAGRYRPFERRVLQRMVGFSL